MFTTFAPQGSYLSCSDCDGPDRLPLYSCALNMAELELAKFLSYLVTVKVL